MAAGTGIACGRSRGRTPTVRADVPERERDAYAAGRVVSRNAMIGGERPSEDDLARGASRFRIYCAVCHGTRGDGISIVGSNMDDPKPPSLLEGAPRELSPERLFDVITNGFGTMPSYAAELSERDRWQVVSYVGALQHRAAADSDTLSAVPLLSRP